VSKPHQLASAVSQANPATAARELSNDAAQCSKAKAARPALSRLERSPTAVGRRAPLHPVPARCDPLLPLTLDQSSKKKTGSSYPKQSLRASGARSSSLVSPCQSARRSGFCSRAGGRITCEMLDINSHPIPSPGALSLLITVRRSNPPSAPSATGLACFKGMPVWWVLGSCLSVYMVTWISDSPSPLCLLLLLLLAVTKESFSLSCLLSHMCLACGHQQPLDPIVAAGHYHA